MAEQLFDSELMPFTHINSLKEKEEEIKPHLLIKNSLKHMTSDLPLALNVDLRPNHLSAYVSSKTKPTETAEKRDMDFLREIKGKMDSRPSCEDPDSKYREIKGMYSRTTKWKGLVNERNAQQALEDDVEEMSQCTFSVNESCNHSRISEQPSGQGNKMYTPISPSVVTVSYTTGMNITEFESRAKNLVGYKPLIP